MEALAKGLRILSLFDEQRPTWRVSDLAAAAGLPMPTVYRVVMTLASEGYLDHLPNGDYRPGVRTLTLGTAALRSLDLVAIATPKLTELGERTGETVNLAVLSGDRVLYLIRLRNSDLVTANIQVGSTLPAVHTSIGKLLLAHLDEAELAARITDASFSANSGPNAKVSLAELRDELRTIRDQGWAMQDEELAYGLRSVAAPITGAGRPRAGRRQPGRPGPGLVDAADHPRAAARRAGHLRGDLRPGVRHQRRVPMTSGARLPKLAPAGLDDEQRALYDAIAGGRRAQGPQLFRLADADGCLEGPFNAFLLQPRLGSALQALGSSVRYETGLDDRCREIAILVVAAHWRSGFEWYAHEAVGRAAGLGDAELAAMREGRYAVLAGREAVVARTAAALAARGDLDDAEYREAVGQLGADGLFELLTLVGYYATLAMQLRVFRVSAPGRYDGGPRSRPRPVPPPA